MTATSACTDVGAPDREMLRFLLDVHNLSSGRGRLGEIHLIGKVLITVD